MKDVILNQLEQTRLHVLNSVSEHQLPAVQGAEILGVSERHAWRLLAAYRRESAASLAHGNRGRKPRNAVSDGEANAVIQLASTTYAGANHTCFTELLRDREGIGLSRPTVRRIPTRAGIPSARRRRPPKHRGRRRRMHQAGMLVQIDGSFHRWLRDYGPQFTLLLAVDDATSAVANAVFSPEEDTRSYFTLMQGLIQRWGRPIALFGDHHGVFKFSGKPRHIQLPVESTHFSRVMEELGIQQIFARSPQAKRRVERAAGTFQDRLATEVHLADAKTIDHANAVLRDFLPWYNTQFAVPAKLARASLPSVVLPAALGPDPLLQAHPQGGPGQHGQVPMARPATAAQHGASQLRRCPIEVLEHTDGRLQVRHEGEIIPSRPARPGSGALRASHGALAPTPEIGRIVKRLGNHRISQPSWKSRGNGLGFPVTAVLHHSVEYGQQFAHACNQSNFFGLDGSQQSLVEDPDHRVVASGDQRPHVERCLHFRPATPRAALATHHYAGRG